MQPEAHSDAMQACILFHTASHLQYERFHDAPSDQCGLCSMYGYGHRQELLSGECLFLNALDPFM